MSVETRIVAVAFAIGCAACGGDDDVGTDAAIDARMDGSRDAARDADALSDRTAPRDADAEARRDADATPPDATSHMLPERAWFDDFEDAARRSSWTILDNDGDGPWELSNGWYNTSGRFAAAVAAAGAIDTDDWLISPRIDVDAAEIEIRAQVRAYVSTRDEPYEIWIAPAVDGDPDAGDGGAPPPSIDAFTRLTEIVATGTEFGSISVNAMPASASFHIAFRYVPEAGEGGRLFLDDIEVRR